MMTTTEYNLTHTCQLQTNQLLLNEEKKTNRALHHLPNETFIIIKKYTHILCIADGYGDGHNDARVPPTF